MTVGQVPLQALRLNVLDDARKRVDLNDYGEVTLVLIDPNGTPVDTSGGSINVGDDGTAVYAWPAVSLFATPGDYRLKLKASGTGVLDWTDEAIVEVRREGR